jgi:arylsulfatase A-like enzyme
MVKLMMGKKITNRRLFKGLLFTALAMSFQVQAKDRIEPNIVILFADDMGYADLSSYGNPYIRTPSIDRLATQGQRWTDFYVAAPVCSPSRGALMTGMLPVRSGLYGRRLGVMFPGDRHGIPDEQLTLAEALSQAGYHTGMFGKWHLGDTPENYPTRHGFDYWYGIPYSNDMDRVGGMSFDEVLRKDKEGKSDEVKQDFQVGRELFEAPESKYWNVPLYRSVKTDDGYKDELVERPVTQETLTKRLTDEALEFMRQSNDRPFLVYLPYSMPHLPIFRSKDFEGQSLRGRYGDAVEEIDWSVGAIRQALEQLGIADNTLIFFGSDNGPWQEASIDQSGSAGMLRGSKGSTWEGGVRIPGIFWGAGRVEPGIVSGIGTTMDVYATVLALAGVTLPEDIDGYDLRATLKSGGPSPRHELPYYSRGNLQAYRKGQWKLHLRDGVSRRDLSKPALFNLHEDPSEQQDVAEKYPHVVADLLVAIEAHRNSFEIKAPIFDMRIAELEY